MKFKKIIYISTIALYLSIDCFGQLPIFTQYKQNPLNINPAFTGYFDDDLKWSALVRSQSYAQLVTSTFYNTSLQIRPYLSFIGANSTMGFGLNAYSNKTLDVFSHQAFSGSLSYEQGLDADGTQSISLGFQGRYNTKRIDYTQLLFPNQFDVIGYTSSLPNNEPIQVINNNYFDVNAGIMYQMENDFDAFTIGLGMYNLNQTNNIKSLNLRKYKQTYNLHLGYSRYTSENSELFLGGMYSTMGNQNATSLVVGYRYQPNLYSPLSIELGAINIFNNGVSPYINVNFSKLLASFTYNIPVNPKTTYLNNNKSFELGLQFLISKYNETNSIARKHMSCF
jgi:type IX secretion system PorP/SprF family membrane protein